MRRTVTRWFWAWDFDKEEKWLNEMAAKGLALVAISGIHYTFEETLPGAYQIRLEMLNQMPSHAESQQYLKFLEETGAEYLGSTLRWVYVRRKSEQGDFDLFSDLGSRIKHLNRILALLGTLLAVELLVGISNMLTFQSIYNQANLYIGSLCIAVGLLLGYGVLQINQKKKKLKKDLQLYEG